MIFSTHSLEIAVNFPNLLITERFNNEDNEYVNLEGNLMLILNL